MDFGNFFNYHSLIFFAPRKKGLVSRIWFRKGIYHSVQWRSGTLIAANTIINYPLLIGLVETTKPAAGWRVVRWVGGSCVGGTGVETDNSGEIFAVVAVGRKG